MQVHKFENGGFVIHKAYQGNTSAWYDSERRLLDAEFFDTMGRARPVKPGTVRWNYLEALGKRVAL